MRPLRLQHPPTVEHAPEFAREMVASAKEISGLELDYGAASLADLDALIEGFRQDGATVDDVAETLWSIGCYVGEVLCRELGGAWVATASTPMAKLAGFPIVVKAGGTYWNPIAKAFKRLENGEEDQLVYFLRVARSQTKPR